MEKLLDMLRGLLGKKAKVYVKPNKGYTKRQLQEYYDQIK